jgi:hypothetical protein
MWLQVRVAPIAIFRQKNVKSRAKEAMQPGFDVDPKSFRARPDLGRAGGCHRAPHDEKGPRP